MFGIGLGPSKEEKSNYNALTGASSFATGLGESELLNSSQFLSGILSGDSSKIAKLLSPQIQEMQGQTQQAKQEASQFGTRSGGVTSYAQTLDDKTRANIDNMISQLTGTAATTLGSQGQGLLSTGMGGYETGFNEAQIMQSQNAAKWDDIIKSIASVAGGVMGGLPGAAGGALDIGSNIAGGLS